MIGYDVTANFLNFILWNGKASLKIKSDRKAVCLSPDLGSFTMKGAKKR